MPTAEKDAAAAATANGEGDGGRQLPVVSEFHQAGGMPNVSGDQRRGRDQRDRAAAYRTRGSRARRRRRGPAGDQDSEELER